jgi:hypothetical protein
MQSADSSLGPTWWLVYQMPGKLQGFKNFRTTWLRLEPDYDYLLATAYVEFFYTPERQFAQPLGPKNGSCTAGCAHVFMHRTASDGRLRGPLQLLLERIREILNRSVETLTVDEEAWCPVHPAAHATGEIVPHFRRELARSQRTSQRRLR